MNCLYLTLWTLLFIDKMVHDCVQASPCNRFEEKAAGHIRCQPGMEINKNTVYVHGWQKNDANPVLEFTINAHRETKRTFSLRQKDCDIVIMLDGGERLNITSNTLEHMIGRAMLLHIRLEKPDRTVACSSSQNGSQTPLQYVVRMCFSGSGVKRVSCGASVHAVGPTNKNTGIPLSPTSGGKAARQIGLGVGLTVGFLLMLGTGILIGLCWKRRSARIKSDPTPAENNACASLDVSNPNINRELPNLPTDSAADYTYLDITYLQSDTGNTVDKNPDTNTTPGDTGESHETTKMVDNQNYLGLDSTGQPAAVARRDAHEENNPRPGSDLVVVENVSYHAMSEDVGREAGDLTTRPGYELAVRDDSSSSHQTHPDAGNVTYASDLEIVDNANYDQCLSECEAGRALDVADRGPDRDNDDGRNYELAKPVT